MLDDRAHKEKMASSSAEVPYNHPTENVLFGQNVIEKISDTCLGQVKYNDPHLIILFCVIET